MGPGARLLHTPECPSPPSSSALQLLPPSRSCGSLPTPQDTKQREIVKRTRGSTHRDPENSELSQKRLRMSVPRRRAISQPKEEGTPEVFFCDHSLNNILGQELHDILQIVLAMAMTTPTFSTTSLHD